MAVGASWPFMQVELLARQRNGGDVRKWNQTLRDSSCSNTTRIGNHNRKERVNFFQKTKKIMDQKQIYVSFLLKLLALRPVVQFPVTTDYTQAQTCWKTAELCQSKWKIK